MNPAVTSYLTPHGYRSACEELYGFTTNSQVLSSPALLAATFKGKEIRDVPIVELAQLTVMPEM